MDTLRLVTARLVKKYHVRLPLGESGHRVHVDMRDQFTANPGRLNLIFTLRQQEAHVG
jgi:hypothetical protein